MHMFKTLRNWHGELTGRDYFWYFIFPGLLLAISMVFYFSGNPRLVEFVCPAQNPEWGAIENLQLIFILGIIIVSGYGAFKKSSLIQQIGFLLVALFSIFIFLEEVDYGKHWADYFYGVKRSLLYDVAGVTNIHNQGNNAKIFKRSVYGLMVIIFFVAPFLKNKIKNKYITYFIPEPKIILTLSLIVIADLLPRFFVRFGIFADAGFGNNIGEFSEIIFYYIFLLYVIQLVFEHKWPASLKSRNAEH